MVRVDPMLNGSGGRQPPRGVTDQQRLVTPISFQALIETMRPRMVCRFDGGWHGSSLLFEVRLDRFGNGQSENGGVMNSGWSSSRSQLPSG